MKNQNEINSDAIHSMTGFSSTQGNVCEQMIQLETKSLNHRFLDIKLKLPKNFSCFDFLIRDLLKKHFSRGSIELRIDKIKSDQNIPEYNLDAKIAKNYWQQLVQLQKELSCNTPPSFDNLFLFPDVISKNLNNEEVSSFNQTTWSALQALIEVNINKLKIARATEGLNLKNALTQLIYKIQKHVDNITKKRTVFKLVSQEKAKEKISSLFKNFSDSIPSDEQMQTRIAQEISFFYDKTDFEEEVIRLDSHLGNFLKTLNEGGTVGRKLDFTLQEIGRETNTLGNKAQDFQIAEEVLLIKTLTEQLREQVLNIE